jgi:uncharacterized membrane protein YkoI
LFVAGIATAATSTHHKQTKVSETKARTAAQAAVPGGKIKSSELEHEHGKLIYSFDIELAGQPGIEEVHVDAYTGKVIAQSHESAKKEGHEKAQEAKETKSGGTGTPH